MYHSDDVAAAIFFSSCSFDQAFPPCVETADYSDYSLLVWTPKLRVLNAEDGKRCISDNIQALYTLRERSPQLRRSSLFPHFSLCVVPKGFLFNSSWTSWYQ